MESCPSCDTQMFAHTDFGFEKKGDCKKCDEKVCPGCYYGTGYTCEIFKLAKQEHECSFCQNLDYRYTMYWVVYRALGKFACSDCAEAILLGK